MSNSYKDGPLPRVSMGVALSPPPHRQDNEFSASFRLMSLYDVTTDGTLTRLDVAIDGKTGTDGMVHGDRAGVLIQSSTPLANREPRDGELSFPRGGPGFILTGFEVRSAPGDLSAALRGLADAIDAFMTRKGA